MLEENASTNDLPTEIWLPYTLGTLLKENVVLRKRLGEMIVMSCGLNKPLPCVIQPLDDRVPLYTSPVVVPINAEGEADEAELIETSSSIHHLSLTNALNRMNSLKNDARWLQSTISVPSFSSLSKGENLETKIKDHTSTLLMLQKELEKIDNEMAHLKDPKQKK
jgi:hypothetical protein